MRLALLVTALLVGGSIVVVGNSKGGNDDALFIAAALLAPYFAGAVFGVVSVPAIGASYLVLSLIYQVAVWTDNPRLSGLDDPSPLDTGVFVVAFVCVAAAAGAATRAFARRLTGERF